MNAGPLRDLDSGSRDSGRAAGGEGAISVQGLRVVYSRAFGRRSLTALDDVSFEVARGDVYGLLGPNGAGKSTTMRCLLGLLKPQAGSVRLLGQAPEPGSRLFAEVGYLPEEPHYHLHLRVGEALRFYAGLAGREISEREIEEALESVELASCSKLRLAKCSKGMKQRLGLAAAFIHRPKLLLLDEPTRGLDPVIVKRVRELILALAADGVTVLMNSHVLPEVESMCNRVAILNRGHLLFAGEVSELRTDSGAAYRVEIDRLTEAPTWLEVLDHRPGAVSASIDLDHVPELFVWAREQGVVVRSCVLHERSLEDAFMEMLEGEDA
ncbi:MAG TPA: ABC transporter ATP-binding protein [Thermoanaerobaculia bacterium]|nr:ABC transporter ATP-binding protein [Thermoanaerobaculia bacterium]